MDEHPAIISITASRGSRRREIRFSGGCTIRLPAPIVTELRLSAGDRLDPDEILRRAGPLEARFARERAMRALAYRDRSCCELRRLLASDGYSDEVIVQTVDSLQERGLLDDARFAEAKARYLVEQRNMGRERILNELRRCGICDEIAMQAVDVLVPADRERERAYGAAKTLARHAPTPERLASRLVRRGFSSSDAIAAAHAVLSDADPDGLGDPA